MEMKWHPIVNGDLSRLPRYEELLFTVFDEIDEQTYVIKGLCTNGWPGSNPYKVLETTIRGCRYHKAKNVKACMGLPEPYKQNPDKCFKCKYVHLQHDEDDEDSDDWFECELLERDVPDNGKPEDCPLR